RIAREYPDIAFDEAIVDATAMRLVVDPQAFDVLVMENLFGDILSDLTSGLVGGIGLAPAANIGDHFAGFEAVHGSAPDIARRRLGEAAAAVRVEHAVRTVIGERQGRTADVGGTATTAEIPDAIVSALWAHGRGIGRRGRLRAGPAPAASRAIGCAGRYPPRE